MSKAKARRLPQRTCIVCGSKKPKLDHLRLVLDSNGSVQYDHRQRTQGRGAYVCWKPGCLTRLNRRQLQKAFRQSLSEAAWSPTSAMVEALQNPKLTS